MIVEVRTGCRLHFGLICSGPGAAWHFGGVGLMLRQPGWRLRVRASEGEPGIARVDDETSFRIRQIVRILQEAGCCPQADVEVLAELPRHSGLGSGTQLALAITAALRRLPGGDQIAPDALERLGRGTRSGIGSAGFERGGLLVDHGVDAYRNRLPIDSLTVPEAWRFLVIRPESGRGLHSASETAYFQRELLMPADHVTRMVSVLEQRLVPAVRTANCRQFAEALEDYGRLAGEFYSAEQGGVFAHPAMRALASYCGAHGIRGLAQSSWGPGACIPVASESDATRLAASLPHELDGTRLLTLVAEPMNCGALVSSPAPADSRAQRA